MPGRDNFLCQEADRTLVSMTRFVSEHRALAALLACTGARAPPSRAKVAQRLDGLLEGGGCRCVVGCARVCARGCVLGVPSRAKVAQHLDGLLEGGGCRLALPLLSALLCAVAPV